MQGSSSTTCLDTDQWSHYSLHNHVVINPHLYNMGWLQSSSLGGRRCFWLLHSRQEEKVFLLLQLIHMAGYEYVEIVDIKSGRHCSWMFQRQPVSSDGFTAF